MSDPSLTLQDSSTVNVSTGDVDNIRTQSRELAASLAGQLMDTYTGDVPLSTSAGSSELNNKPSDGVTGESTKPSASGSSGPLGLGGGLQPKVLNTDSLVFSNTVSQTILFCSHFVASIDLISASCVFCNVLWSAATSLII
jgi:hypothetical protein